MAELFWTMEKEPIAGALLASILLNSLCNKTDDFTDKEDYRSYAKNFQERAEGVLNECYREDEHRAQLIINHQLVYYGRSSVIKLAAEGQSIKFMAHPCCQDFLTNTWNGNLSTKNSAIRLVLGLVFGLIMPFLLPKVILYNNKINDAIQDKDKTPDSSLNATQEESLIGLSQHPDRKGKPQKSITSKAVDFIGSIRDFYMAPVVRFVYHTLSYITFLLLFSYLLLVDFRVKISPVEYIVTAWVVTLFIEEIKQICWAVLSGISFRTYISDGWNKLDCVALALFVVGFIMRMIVLADKDDFDLKNENFIIITDEMLNMSRICLAISLFTFYIRLMYTFSFHIALGPKLIMIGKMVTNDLIPFMVILTVIIVGYAVASQSIAYPNGIYSNKEEMNSSMAVKTMLFQETIFQMYTKAYFQMFGDFALDVLQGDDDDCDKDGKCPTKTSRWLIPLMLGFYVVLTNTLMFNLLIAMFSKTYEEIESASTYYWNYQRYQMIAEYVHRSPLAPPLILFWHFVEAYNAINNKCASIRNNDTVKENPFCVSFKDLKKEREMVKWEHMKAMDYLREPSQKSGGKRGGAESRAVVFRGGGGAGAAAGAGVDFKSEMTSVAEGIGMELEKRFKDIDQHFQKFTDVDNRLNDVTGILNGLGDVVKHITETQERICKQISDLPSCQCNELTDEVVETKARAESETSQAENQTRESPPVVSRRRTKLEMAVQAALEAAKDVLRPPTPPPPPPIMPPPVVESPMEIGLAEPGSEEDSSGNEEGGDPEADEAIEPTVSDDKHGRTIERNVVDHRIWRIYPFNFEKYPGMRMNVPPDKVPWTVEYTDYFAYDSSEEALKFPSPESHDGGNEHLRQMTFNQYDTKAKVRRQSLLGRYRLDPRTGAPLNPMGRTGLLGKGLLPRWGPNHAIVVVISKYMRNPQTNEPIIRSNKSVLKYIALERNKRFCIPWFLVDHLNKCDFDECVPAVVKKFVEQKIRARCSEKMVERILKRLERADIVQLFKGYLDDQLNADSAWLETVVLNIHEGQGKGTLFPEDILKIFQEGHEEETVKWMEVCQNTNLRTSHNYILKSVADHRNAFY